MLMQTLIKILFFFFFCASETFFFWLKVLNLFTTTYNREILLGIMSKLYIIHGTNTINAMTIGNNIVQENDISWSKRILGKDALTQIKTKTITQAFTPSVRPYIIPSINGVEKNAIISSNRVS